MTDNEATSRYQGRVSSVLSSALVVFDSPRTTLLSALVFFVLMITAERTAFLMPFAMAAHAFTAGSHVSAIGQLADVPAAFAGGEAWPFLGKFLAGCVLGVQNQSNTGFVATDGVSAVGEPGGLIIVVLCTVWLVAFGWASQQRSKKLLLAALYPLAVETGSGPIFTQSASFGGGLWITKLWFDKFKTKFGGHRL
ncbi:hypothetical protein [Pseudomonas sp.]|uniref:hypothetical protein n=1 Tax=Pseudomonas sp. TaxID=306 RepID=UPI001B24370D|nr:hypothetical protein [Pseudomonas sp.]MBO9552017.1 hypothetical protein [Pseudomonas sp.]